MERQRKIEVESLRHQPAAVQPQQQAPEHAQQMCMKEFGMCARAAAHLQREAPQRALGHGHQRHVVLQQGEGFAQATQGA